MTADEAANPSARAPEARLVSLDQIDRLTKAAQLALEAKEAIIAARRGRSAIDPGTVGLRARSPSVCRGGG